MSSLQKKIEEMDSLDRAELEMEIDKKAEAKQRDRDIKDLARALGIANVSAAMALSVLDDRYKK